MRRILVTLSLLVAASAALGGVANAQTDPYGPGSETSGEVIERMPVSDGAEVLPSQVTRDPDPAASAASQSLPVTGGDVLALAALGSGAVVVGTGLVRYRRRIEG